MKFLLISALLIMVIMTMNNSISLAVYNGKQAVGNEFNWVVVVYVKRENVGSVGTGSIISELHILTAAHCVKNVKEENAKIIAGAVSLYNPARSDHRVRKIRKHELYGKEFMSLRGFNYDEAEYASSDIAILTLETALTFGENIGKISLPTHELDLSQRPLCNVAGWGHDVTGTPSKILLWTAIRMGSETDYSSPFCRAEYRMMCGMSPDRNTYLAGGDSGSGLQCNGVLAAVHVAGGRNVNLKMLFQSVFHHLPFIYRAMNEDEDSIATTTTPTISKPRRSKPGTCVCL